MRGGKVDIVVNEQGINCRGCYCPNRR
jgi:hypothetical protein